MRTASLCFLCLVVLLSGAARVCAQVDAPSSDEMAGDRSVDPSAEAQELFRRGLSLGEENRWAEALEHFRRSLSRVPRPSTLYNIGVALGRLGRFVEAIEAFDQLFQGTEPLPDAVRVEAERLRSEAVASLGELALTIDPPSAALFVDGVSRAGDGATRTLPLDPGRHVLRATAPEHEEGVVEVSVVAGEHATRRLVLASLLLDPPPPVASTSLFDEPAFWIVSGAIVVVLGVGIGVGVGVATSGPSPQYGGSTGVVLLAP